MSNFYMGPDRNDAWSGLRATSEKGTQNGPWATLSGALAKLADLRRRGQLAGPVTVWLRGGRYEMTKPAVATPAHSWPVTFKAYRDEKPVLSGGKRLNGWKRGMLSGKPVWTTDLPDVRSGDWEFRSLFVNEARAPRPRFPGKGLFRMAGAPGMSLPAGWGNGGQTAFECATGDVKAYHNWLDSNSVAADPKCRNLRKRDFRLKPDSPAFKIGFKEIDLSGVGPRRKDRRGPVRGSEPDQLGIMR